MKKLIAFVIAAVMVLSMIPAMAFSTSAAAVEGDWMVYRSAKSYEEEENGEIVRPNVGYEYVDGEGLVIVAPDWTNYTPYFLLQTKESWNLKDGFYMEVRVDEFTVKDSADQYVDHWISFNLSDRVNIELGSSSHGNNWCCLIRNEDNGTVRAGDGFTSHWTTMTTEDTVGSFGLLGADAANMSIPTDDNGSEIYTFEVTWDGTDYTLKVNGLVVPGNAQVSANLKALNDDGEFYPGIAFNSGAKDGTVSCTLVKYGTSAEDATTPVGSDSLEPEDNRLVFGDPIDPTTIAENAPGLMWDATQESFKNDPTGVDLALTAQGDNSYHVQAVGPAPYFQWGIKSELTVMQSDFPVFAMLLKDFWFDEGGLYFCAGDVMSPNENYKVKWSIYDDDCLFFGEDDEYVLVVIDLATLGALDETTQGRIHCARPFFSVTDTSDPEIASWDICYMGYFRSVEEAQTYTMERYSLTSTTTPDTTADADTDPVGDPDTDVSVDDTTVNAEDTTVAETTVNEGATTAGDDEKSGCGAVIGTGAAMAILAAAAAAVALKKKD